MNNNKYLLIVKDDYNEKNRPDYLKIDKKNETWIKKACLYISIFILFIFLILTIGECFPSSGITSYTRWRYYSIANNILTEIKNGAYSDVIDNTVADTISKSSDTVLLENYSAMTADTKNSLSNAHQFLYGNNKAKGYVLSLSTNESYASEDSSKIKKTEWISCCNLMLNNKTFIDITITFSSFSNYSIQFTMHADSDTLTSEEKDVLLDSDELIAKYAIYKEAIGVYNTLRFALEPTNTVENTLKYNLLQKQGVGQSRKHAVGRIFVRGYIDTENEKIYQEKIGNALTALSEYYEISSIHFDTLSYITEYKALLRQIEMTIKDKNGNIATVFIPCLTTPNGYRIYENGIKTNATDTFDIKACNIITNYITTETAESYDDAI